MDPNKKPQNANVETYAEDMAKALAGNTGGAIKTIIEGEENKQQKSKFSPESKKNRMFLWWSIILLCAAGAALSFIFLNNRARTVDVPAQFVPPIFNDKTAYLEVNGLKSGEIIATILAEMRKVEVRPDGVEGIYLTYNQKIVGLRQFLALTQMNFTPGNPALVDNNFMLGYVNNGTTDSNGFFMLIQMRSLNDIFDSMDKWESKMFSDLHGLIGQDLGPDTNYLLTQNFQDGIIENKNARLLYDKNGKPVLLYLYADDNSVIITDSLQSAREVMLRLASGKAKQ